jgi:hypothetical protein
MVWMPVFGIATFSDVHELYLYLCLWTRRLAKATGAEPSGWMRDQTLQVAVVRSTQNTSAS